METGKLVRELRIKKGMTQEDLASRTEVSTRTIQRIENGEVDPRAYTLQTIAKALEVDFSIFNYSQSDEDDKIVSKRNWLALIHLSVILPLFFPTIIIWDRKKDEIKEMNEHFRAVITFHFTYLLACLAGLWGYYWSGIPWIIIGIVLINVFFSIRNTIQVLNGKPYAYYGPFNAKQMKGSV